VLQDARGDLSIRDERDDAHSTAASDAEQKVDPEHALEQCCQGLRPRGKAARLNREWVRNFIGGFMLADDAWEQNLELAQPACLSA